MQRSKALALFLGLAVLTLYTAAAHAQTWGYMHARTLILPGSGNDFAHTLTLQAPALSSSPSITLPGEPLIFPFANTSGILTNDGSGNLTWSTLGVGTLTPGTANTFLITNSLGATAWAGLNISSNLTGDGIGTALDISSSYAGGPAISTVGTITSGTWNGTPIGPAYGGLGIDLTGVTDGQLIIGQTSDHSFGLSTLTAGTNMAITNGGHSISLATVNDPVFSTSVTTPTIYGGNAAGSALNLQSTSSGSPSGDYITMNVAGTEVLRMNSSGMGIGTTSNGNTVYLNGTFAIVDHDVTIAGNSTNDNVAIGSTSILHIKQSGTAGPSTITGFSGGFEGTQISIVNFTGYPLTLANLTGSSAGNQIYTRTGTDVILPVAGVAQLRHDDDVPGAGWAVEFTGGTNSIGTGGTGVNSFTQNGILYGNGINPIQVTSPAANSILVTDGSNVPSLSQTLPSAVQANITSLTGMTGAITYPTGLTFDGSSSRTESLARNSGSNPGSGLILQAGAPMLSSAASNLNGGDLTLSSGISEGTGLSNIIFQTPATGSIGNADNTPATRLTINSTQINLASGMELDQNGTQRISSSGAGTFSGLTLGSPLTGANGGTGSTYVSFTSGGSTARTYTLPDANATLLSTTTGVQLQSTTPGTAQNGNVNVAGVLLADSIGVATSSPKGGLDVEGTMVYGVDSITIVGSSTNNDVSPGSKVDAVIGMSGTPGPAIITGFSGGAQGRFIKIANLTGQNVTLANLSSSSSAANRIYTATGQDLVLPPNSLAALTYTTEAPGWNIEYTGGMPVAISLGGTGATTAAGALANLLPSSPTTGYFLEWNGSAFVWNSASASPGVVTSIGIDPGTTGLTVSNSPITSSGNIGLAGTLSISHGGTGQTTANGALNALLPSQATHAGQALITDGTNTSWTAVGTGNGTVTSVDVAIPGMTSSGAITTTGTISMSGDLAVSNGGTGQGSSLTQGGVVYGSSTTAMASSAAGSSGQVLISGGTGAPSFTSTVSGLTITNSSIGSSNPSTGTFTSVTSPNVYGGSAASSTLNLQSTSNGSPSGDYITFTTSGSERARITNSGWLGLGMTPNTTLDVNGKISIADDTVTIAGASTNNNVSSGSTSRLSIGLSGSAAPATITGFTGGTTGSLLTIINLTGQNVTLANNNSSSTYGNRIWTQTGGDVVIPSSQSVNFSYDQDYGAWLMEGVGGLNPVGAGGTGATSFTLNGILYGNGANSIQVTSAAANSILATNGTNVPSLTQTLPSAVQANITSLTGMTGAITYPTGLTFNGTSGITESLQRNTGTNPGSALTIQAGAPASLASSNDLAGGDLTLSSGTSEGSGISSIVFQTPAAGSSGNADNTPATRLTLDANNLNLGSGIGLETNGTARISSAGAGMLASLSLTSPLSLANGGTNASLTASNGGIFYSTGSAGAILPGTSTANQVLLSGASTTPAWSTATYPATAGTAGDVLQSDGTNWVSTAGGWTTVKMSSDFTRSANSLASITGLSFSATASTTYEIDAWLDVVEASTGGCKFAVNSSGTSPTVLIIYQGPAGNNATGVNFSTNTNNTVETTAFITGNGAEGFVHICGIVKSGTGSPTISIGVEAGTNGNQLTVKAGSKLMYRVQ